MSKSAEQGNVPAQLAVTNAYRFGDGTEIDKNLALHVLYW